MIDIFKNIAKVFTAVSSTTGGEALVSSKKIWFNIASAITFIVPIVGLVVEQLKFTDVLSYMTIIFPVAGTVYVIGKAADGKNYVQTTEASARASQLGQPKP